MASVSEHLEAPIIIIGAGRSGTYLLERMLNAHPDILMYGETAFLLPRLWRELRENSPPAGLNANRLGADVFLGEVPTSFQERQAHYRAIPKEVEEQERHRIGRLSGATLAGLLGVPADHEGWWGYREIWNGSTAFQHDWNIYDLAFPGAFWVQIIRDPFDFAVSCAAWNGEDLTSDYLKKRLRDWVAMIRWNRNRRDIGRYYECRYEDLIAEPSRVLAPLLQQIGLRWNEACAAELNDHTGRSVHKPSFPICTMEPVAGLPETMDELGYEIPGLYRPLLANPKER